MLSIFSSSGVVIWSQGSNAVFESCFCNFFQFFLNFQVLFKLCSCSFCQVQWSYDLRVQTLCSRHVPVIYFKFSPIFKCCSSHVLAVWAVMLCWHHVFIVVSSLSYLLLWHVIVMHFHDTLMCGYIIDWFILGFFIVIFLCNFHPL